MARGSRGAGRLVGLVTHSDAGSQFTSVRFTERLDEIGARPAIGTVADSYDNALAETTNGLYKTECVYGPDTTGWDDVDHLELATLSLGALVQRGPPPRPLRRHPASRVRSSVLRCPTSRPPRGWNPITRASIRPRAVQSCRRECAEPEEAQPVPLKGSPSSAWTLGHVRARGVRTTTTHALGRGPSIWRSESPTSTSPHACNMAPPVLQTARGSDDWDPRCYSRNRLSNQDADVAVHVKIEPTEPNLHNVPTTLVRGGRARRR